MTTRGHLAPRPPLCGLLRLAALALVLGYIALAFAFLWPQDLSSASSWRVAVDHAAFIGRTFSFHALLAMAVLTAVFLIARRHRWWLIGLPAAASLVVAASPLSTGGPAVPPLESHDGHLVVMSANLLANRPGGADALLEQINELKPDVICLQEYSPAWHDLLKRLRETDYPHVAHLARRDAFGAAVYSRRPFLEEPWYFPQTLVCGQPWGEPQIRVVVEHAGRSLAVWNVHLLPPASMSLIREQRLQAVVIAEAMRAERLPVVVAGDFNATGASEHLRVIRGDRLHDAHAAVGTGRGSTWPRLGTLRHLPGIRLDHVLATSELTPVSCHVGDDFGSDHAPIWSVFRWK